MRSGKCLAFSRFLRSMREDAVMMRMAVMATVPHPQPIKSHPPSHLGAGGAGQLAERLVRATALEAPQGC